MEKNVTVVDEQGHEYGATYPKRAKGLVKNGRARFVDERTICLACPPNEILEDKNMSENINIAENTDYNAVLTEKEVFDQIVLLQKQLTEQSPTSLHRLGEAIYDARGEGEDAHISDEQVASICAVFAQREETLREILEFYKACIATCVRNRTPDKDKDDDVADGSEGQDPKFNEALRIAVENNRISTSMLQRTLSIGYGRATKIIDEMERRGFVGPDVDNKPREIRITKETYAELS